MTSTTRPTNPPRTAASIPTLTPSTMTSSSAPSASDRVTGSRAPNSSVTGRPLTIEVPRSPVTAFSSHDPYWTRTGRSAPS